MGRNKQPVELLVAKGKKHLTKAEIEERKNSEMRPINGGNIQAPKYLTKKQAEEFSEIVLQLTRLNIIGETDTDAVARYVIAKELYLNAVKMLKKRDTLEDPFLYEQWSKIQERYFKQCRAMANDLGLSITARCKLVAPKVEEPKVNKFKKFESGETG